jgi:glycosyltransferase involved in cell wall biosynthesis
VSADPQLSVVIIALDAADVLPAALGSLPAGAEIVVADGGSSDGTPTVALELGARVVPQDLAAVRQAGGVFDVARNAAAGQARGEWILHLDADERLSPALAREIVELVSGKPDAVAYEMPRRNLFWGQPVRILGLDYQLRLVRRGHGRFTGGTLHRRMLVDGSIGRLDTPIIHLNVRGWGDVLRRFRRYVPVEALALGRRPGLVESLSRPVHLFRFYYIRNEAFRDGARGLIASAIYAFFDAAVLWTARRNEHASR